MKNYLFAPFKNDDDKIEEFNAVVNALNYVVDAEETHHHESALHGLRVFIGRLESYYDVTISELSNKCAVAVADERVIQGLEDGIADLKAENNKLKADKHNLKANCDLDWAEIKELKAENVRLQRVNESMHESMKIVKAENDRLVEQVSSISGNSSSTHTHTQKEIELHTLMHGDACKDNHDDGIE